MSPQEKSWRLQDSTLKKESFSKWSTTCFDAMFSLIIGILIGYSLGSALSTNSVPNALTLARYGRQGPTVYLDDLLNGDLSYIEKVCEPNEGLQKSTFLVQGITEATNYAGMIPIRQGVELFFWYFPSRHTVGKPLIIWLQGGPGESSLLTAFRGNGPLVFDPSNTSQFRTNPNSWLDDGYALLYIDSPVGSGFSTNKGWQNPNLNKKFYDNKGQPTNTVGVAQDLVCFMKTWDSIFHIRDQPVYITGESYAGKFIPAFGIALHRYNSYLSLTRKAQGFNILGLAVSSPMMDAESQSKTQPEFLYYLGLISEDQRLVLTKKAENIFQLYNSGQMLRAIFAAADYMDKLTKFSVDANLFDIRKETYDSKQQMEAAISKIRRKLNVFHDQPFQIFTPEVNTVLLGDFLHSALPLYQWILANLDWRILIYQGDFDAQCGIAASLSYRSKLVGTLKRKPWMLNGTLAGFVTEAGNLTIVDLMRAGHRPVHDRSAETKLLMRNWVGGYALVN